MQVIGRDRFGAYTRVCRKRAFRVRERNGKCTNVRIPIPLPLIGLLLPQELDVKIGSHGDAENTEKDDELLCVDFRRLWCPQVMWPDMKRAFLLQELLSRSPNPSHALADFLDEQIAFELVRSEDEDELLDQPDLV